MENKLLLLLAILGIIAIRLTWTVVLAVGAWAIVDELIVIFSK